jgi:hypothetical protein
MSVKITNKKNGYSKLISDKKWESMQEDGTSTAFSAVVINDPAEISGDKGSKAKEETPGQGDEE